MRPCLLAPLLVLVSCKGRDPVLKNADDLFSGRAIWRFELTLGDAAREQLGKEKRKFVSGAFRHGDLVLQDVGIRFKGHRAMRGWAGKPAFKVKFDEYVEGRTFLGIRSLTLNNLVEDPTLVREALAYRVYREAGAPAPRTAYVELSVDGKPFGLYLAVESIDEEFARARLDGEAHVYEGEYGCDLHPEDVPGFEVDVGDKHDRADLLALAEAAHHDPARVLGELVNEKAVLGFLAAAAWLGDFDGYRHSHNYRLYRSPRTGRWMLIPWGVDRTFKKRLSIYDSDGMLARLCFVDHDCRLKYLHGLQVLTARVEELELPRQAEAIYAAIAAAAARDPKTPFRPAEIEAARKALKAFLTERPGEIARQTACLAGEREVDRDGDGAACMDCDDAQPTIHPGAAEDCNGVDDDCSGVVDDEPACACQAQVVEGAQFFLCDRPMSFADAEAFCRSQGHLLARLDSARQSKALFKVARKLKKDRWWIGLSDRAQEGDFRWVDGSPLAYTRWAKGQPDNDGCHEDCVALKDGTKGKWHDTHCAQRRPFICAAPSPAPAGAPVSEPSDDGDDPGEDTRTDTGAE